MDLATYSWPGVL